MRIFISWSGERSKAVAELLHVWIRCVLQATQPWISTKQIDRGALWFTEIGDQLKDTKVGIVCLTLENKDRPWILFEAGALAKGLSSNRVCTLLIDMQPANLIDPLAQFNHTLPTKHDMRALLETLNDCLEANALPAKILDTVFEQYWPDFATNFAKVLADTNALPTVAGTRSDSELLEEILENTRLLTKQQRSHGLEMDSEPLLKVKLPLGPTLKWRAIREIRQAIANNLRQASIVLDMERKGFSEAQILEAWAAYHAEELRGTPRGNADKYD